MKRKQTYRNDRWWAREAILMMLSRRALPGGEIGVRLRMEGKRVYFLLGELGKEGLLIRVPKPPLPERESPWTCSNLGKEVVEALWARNQSLIYSGVLPDINGTVLSKVML